MMSVTPILRPSWVLVPNAVASMVSFLSRAKPETVAAIIKLRTSTLNAASFADFDSFDIVLSSCFSKPGDSLGLARRRHYGLRCFDSFGRMWTASYLPQKSCFTRLRLQWTEHARTKGSTAEPV